MVCTGTTSSFLNSKFRGVLNVECFLPGNYPASEFYMPTFRNTLSVPSSWASGYEEWMGLRMLGYSYGKRFGSNRTFSHINTPTFSIPVILHTYPPMKMEQSAPKRRHIKFRRRGITQKKAYNFKFAFLLLGKEFTPKPLHNPPRDENVIISMSVTLPFILTAPYQKRTSTRNQLALMHAICTRRAPSSSHSAGLSANFYYFLITSKDYWNLLQKMSLLSRPLVHLIQYKIISVAASHSTNNLQISQRVHTRLMSGQTRFLLTAVIPKRP